MATLIGAGGHARDILATAEDDLDWDVIPWHEDADMEEGTQYVIGINDPQIRDHVRRFFGWDDLMWRHPCSWVGPECSWGAGTHINYMVSMTRTTIGHHTTVAPGVTICGDVVIGDRVFIGAGATIINLVTIGDDAYIRAGSVVTRDIAAGERY